MVLLGKDRHCHRPRDYDCCRGCCRGCCRCCLPDDCFAAVAVGAYRVLPVPALVATKDVPWPLLLVVVARDGVSLRCSRPPEEADWVGSPGLPYYFLCECPLTS